MQVGFFFTFEGLFQKRAGLSNTHMKYINNAANAH